MVYNNNNGYGDIQDVYEVEKIMGKRLNEQGFVCKLLCNEISNARQNLFRNFRPLNSAPEFSLFSTFILIMCLVPDYIVQLRVFQNVE